MQRTHIGRERIRAPRSTRPRVVTARVRALAACNLRNKYSRSSAKGGRMRAGARDATGIEGPTMNGRVSGARSSSRRFVSPSSGLASLARRRGDDISIMLLPIKTRERVRLAGNVTRRGGGGSRVDGKASALQFVTTTTITASCAVAIRRYRREITITKSPRCTFSPFPAYLLTVSREAPVVFSARARFCCAPSRR